MNRLLAVIALAGAFVGCDVNAAPTQAAVKLDGPTYTQRVKIDDV